MVTKFFEALERNGYDLMQQTLEFKNPIDLLEALQFHVHTSSSPIYFPVAYKREVGHLSREEVQRARNSHEPIKYRTETSVITNLSSVHGDNIIYKVKVEVSESYMSSDGMSKKVISKETGIFYGHKFKTLPRFNGEAVLQICLEKKVLDETIEYI